VSLIQDKNLKSHRVPKVQHNKNDPCAKRNSCKIGLLFSFFKKTMPPAITVIYAKGHVLPYLKLSFVTAWV